MFPYFTGKANLDRAIDDALLMANQGNMNAAVQCLLAAIADEPVPKESENEKRMLITEMRAFLVTKDKE